MKDAVLEAHAPKVARALARKGGNVEDADRSLVEARAIVAEVNRLQASGDEIIAILARHLYATHEAVREENREAMKRASVAAWEGAAAVVKTSLEKAIAAQRSGV